MNYKMFFNFLNTNISINGHELEREKTKFKNIGNQRENN